MHQQEILKIPVTVYFNKNEVILVLNFLVLKLQYPYSSVMLYSRRECYSRDHLFGN